MLVTTKQASEEIQDQDEAFEEDPDKKNELRSGEDTNVELDGRRRFFRLRSTWSWFILGWITSLILFNISLTVLVGVQRLSFPGYEWFITTVTVETFLQVVGLGYVAAKFLFSDGRG